MKKIFSILSLFVLALSVAGCTNNSSASNACSEHNKEVILVTDTGGVNDKSFNQGTWEGIQKACEQLKIGAEYIESKTEADLENNLRKAASEGNIIIASGFLFEKAIGKVAKEFPDKQFIFIDGSPKDDQGKDLELPNVYSYFFNEAEAGYLVGYIAGKKTKSNKIGFVGGLEIPPVQQFGWGFIQGVQAANPQATVSYEYTNSFDDTTKGKVTAQSQIARGVDIIFTAAGGVNDGVVEAAIESTKSGTKVDVIGVDRDMYDVGKYEDDKSVILTSAVKRTGNAAINAIETIKKGEKPKTINRLSVADDFVGVPEVNPNLKDDEKIIQEAKDSLQKAINDKTLVTKREDLNIQITIEGKY